MAVASLQITANLGLQKGVNRVHCCQAEGTAFNTPEELLQAVDLYNLTQKTFRSELQVRRAVFVRNLCRLSKALVNSGHGILAT